MPFDEINDWYGGISSTAGHDYTVGYHINDELFRGTPRGLEPGVISQIIKDQSTNMVTLELNTRCKWSDGRPITASDIKAGMEAIFHPLASSAIPLDGIFVNGEAVKSGEKPVQALGIEVLDDHRLRFPTEVGVINLATRFSDEYFVPMPSWLIETNPAFPFSNRPPPSSQGHLK